MVCFFLFTNSNITCKQWLESIVDAQLRAHSKIATLHL